MNINETLQERAETHGNFHEGAVIFNDILKHVEKSTKLDSTHKYAITMIATKLARILNGNPHEVDHWRDIAGYATLGGRLDIPEESLSPQPLNAFVELPVVDTNRN
ncbi:hypothetical protein BKG91_09035 [Rodentibacter caecimuris]|uniref:DUF6378 domain-containing protein n=1 Tax=Rodentibacter caecimuris TaxID=1796644 RepID=A0AAJ3MZJ6_9PAST|nr:DUF6378 domain-containing protein [Rodentibacter heylii]AOF54486.1 Phage protein [Pasteurellaceae bacterium NI1060]MCQ9122738.1 hypothetical protein [Rodentibacter heylii]OOF72591.1 hypothetical protein BKG90_03815 [Rodentibacter heylii]OOF73682.1 hypothetical protein BKG91_09035 [Rodentibacter heylii]OOF78567.1 hypothetical protein BKG99_00440 [Rodentibacter heylii]